MSNQASPQFIIRRIYLKGLSFESPQGGEAFINSLKPKIEQSLRIKAKKLDENLHEVTLRLTATAFSEKAETKHPDDRITVFLVEVEQAGLFELKGMGAQKLTRALNTSCPQLLFPYASAAIDTTLSKATFPALMLPPINFDALFEQAMSEKDPHAKTH